MLSRALPPAALACLLVLPLGTAAAQGFRYATGTAQYRMTMQAKITQTVMGQANDVDMSSGQKFTITLTPQAADTLGLAVTIDSIAQDMGQMGPVPGIDKLVGKKVSATISPAGKFYASTSKDADADPVLSGVADQLEHVLPYIRVALARGVTWTDTTTGTTNQGGIDVKREVISTYVVEGDTTIAGVKAWKLTRTSSAKTSGSGMIQGQNASMDGTSKGSGHAYLSHQGTFLAGDGHESVVAKLTLTDAGMAYDITTAADTKIEKVN